jgi:hypothetical protein
LKGKRKRIETRTAGRARRKRGRKCPEDLIADLPLSG